LLSLDTARAPLLSFEMVRWLRRNRKPMPVSLFVSGHRAPHIPRITPALHLADDATFTAEMRKLNRTPEEVLALASPLRDSDGYTAQAAIGESAFCQFTQGVNHGN
jgi:hypothetical protein